jgi:hypothetical protein
MLYGTRMPHRRHDTSNIRYRPRIWGFLTFYTLINITRGYRCLEAVLYYLYIIC